MLLSLRGASVVTLAKLLVHGLLIAGDIHLIIPNFALVVADIAHLVVIAVMPVMVGMVIVVVGVCRETGKHDRNHRAQRRGLNPILH